MLKVPVLLIIFNRPEITMRTFAQIRKAKPRQLFVAADGPRPGHPDDRERCRAAREVINEVDWDCELKTLFRDQNRGCGYGPAEAITWFFEHVEHGIILEDDCMPSESFFPYCAELLQKYSDDEKIWVISGTNPLKRWYTKRSSYIITKMGGTWGWATWRRAWKHFDYEAKKWFTKEGREKVSHSLGKQQYVEVFAKEFDHYFETVREDVWDYQWLFARYYHGALSIVPSVNLISNIGFGEDATHTKDETFNMPGRQELEFPLTHPGRRTSRFYDRLVFERFINPQPRSFFKKAVMKAAKIITGTN